MIPHVRVRSTVLAALILLIAFPVGVQGYAGQVPANVTITGPSGAVQCGATNTFQATVIESAGTRVTAQPVTWSIVSGPLGAGDTIIASSTTDSNGVATTTVQFSGPAGARTLRATAGTAFGQIVVEPTGCTSVPTPVSLGTCASAVGNLTSAAFSQATKVRALRGYITFRLSFGPAFAGKEVMVTRTVRAVPFAGWGSFFGGTARTADANGDAYYMFRSLADAWISVRGYIAAAEGDGAAISKACQGRWR